MRNVFGIGETVFDIIFRNGQPVGATPGGSTYNSMISLGRAGVHAAFISETGDDRVGRQIIEFLEQNGVSGRNVFIHRGQKSALSLAFLNDQNDAEYVFYKDHAKDKLFFEYPEIHTNDVVLFGSFYAINDVVRAQVRDFLRYAKERGAILYYDINFRASHKQDAERLMPNIQENLELADFVRASSEDCSILFELSDVDDIYTRMISPYTKSFIYTNGGESISVRSPEPYCYDVPKIETVSTIGAGDSFNAGFIYGLIRDNITRETIENGLTPIQWNDLIEYGRAFSANVCQSLYNYIDTAFIDTK